MKWFTPLLATFVMAFFVATATAVEEPTAEDYINCFKPVAGTWIGTATIDGEVKKREWTVELSPTQRCFVTYETEDGKPFYHSMDGYDPATGRYKVVGFYADGSREVVSFKLDKKTLAGGLEGLKYRGRMKGINAKGEKTSARCVSNFLTRDKWRLRIMDYMIGDEKQPDIELLYERR